MISQKFFTDKNICSKYDEFYELLILNNEKFNLTTIVDDEDFIIKHVVDSVYYDDIFDKNASVIEIGSGAGFPSVPLKIKREDLKFTLIEANEKKCGFLKTVKENFGFDDFEIVCGRAEEIAQKEGFKDCFDYAVARAVAPLNILCEMMLPFVKVGGFAVAYKGLRYEEELSAARSAIKKLGGEVAEIKNYSLPNDMGERALVVIKKIAPTPEGFPRRYAKIKKCPL